jgi:hypothetical protein
LSRFLSFVYSRAGALCYYCFQQSKALKRHPKKFLGGIFWRKEFLLSRYAIPRRAVSKGIKNAQKRIQNRRFCFALLKKFNKR